MDAGDITRCRNLPGNGDRRRETALQEALRATARLLRHHLPCLLYRLQREWVDCADFLTCGSTWSFQETHKPCHRRCSFHQEWGCRGRAPCRGNGGLRPLGVPRTFFLLYTSDYNVTTFGEVIECSIELLPTGLRVAVALDGGVQVTIVLLLSHNQEFDELRRVDEGECASVGAAILVENAAKGFAANLDF